MRQKKIAKFPFERSFVKDRWIFTCTYCVRDFSTSKWSYVDDEVYLFLQTSSTTTTQHWTVVFLVA